MKLETVSYKDRDGKLHTVVLSKNQAVKLLISKFDGEIFSLRIREVAC